MKLESKILVIAVSAALAAAVPLFAYHARRPVLVVTEQSFIPFYGEARIRREEKRSSAALFRKVKTAAVADDAGADIVQFAIAEISAKPFCVLFPQRFAHAARIYREQNPAVKAILLEGRQTAGGNNPALSPLGGNTGDYFLFKTDIESDFYRAGLAAAVLDGDKNGRVAVFLEPHVQAEGKEVFLRALNDTGKPLQTSFFTSYSEFSAISGLSCVVLSGAGADYLDKYSGVPVIIFSWLDPSFLPKDVILVFDDSPWVQASGAVRAACAGMADGLLPSKTMLLPEKGIDRGIIRKLRKIGEN
jgi:hypothetical protein